MLFFLVIGSERFKSHADENHALSPLESFSIECIQTSQSSACRKAVFHAEVLQRQAASAGSFSCQSRLLGLEADLIMSSFKTRRVESALAMLKEVKVLCREL